MTTREELARYVAKLSASVVDDDTTLPTRTPSERQWAQKRADVELR